MTGTHFLKRVGALVVALAVLITLQTHAKSAGAQLGTVTAVGSLTSRKRPQLPIQFECPDQHGSVGRQGHDHRQEVPCDVPRAHQ